MIFVIQVFSRNDFQTDNLDFIGNFIAISINVVSLHLNPSGLAIIQIKRKKKKRIKKHFLICTVS